MAASVYAAPPASEFAMVIRPKRARPTINGLCDSGTSGSNNGFERNIRDQLGRTLQDGGFDPARDITAITVNRWPMAIRPNTIRSGAHAPFFSTLFLTNSPRRCVGLVGAAEEEDSFPLTDRDILPAARMFFAALTS